jgi:hypothetical protein
MMMTGSTCGYSRATCCSHSGCIVFLAANELNLREFFEPENFRKARRALGDHAGDHMSQIPWKSYASLNDLPGEGTKAFIIAINHTGRCAATSGINKP